MEPIHFIVIFSFAINDVINSAPVCLMPPEFMHIYTCAYGGYKVSMRTNTYIGGEKAMIHLKW